MDVVCVAERSKIPVWRYASVALPQRIKAESYRLIVPSLDLETFTACSPREFHVESEDRYIADFGPYLKACMAEWNEERYGWYLQQLIKLEALKRLAEAGKVGLIWDADTIPLKQISFFDRGQTLLYRGEEHHTPYFQVISRLLNMNRIVSHSFVAQCFPCQPRWILSLCEEIEQTHGAPWWKALIDNIDFRERSGFSEYETLGTFVSHRFPNDWNWNHRKWTRDGYSTLGTPQEAYERSVNGDVGLDFAAFEHWEDRGKTSSSGVLKLLDFLINRIRVFFSGRRR